MSDRSNSTRKSPLQSQRSTPQDPSTELGLCVPIMQQNPTSSQSRTTLPQNEQPNIPTRARWVSTQSQSQKQSAQNTPTNSLVCIPRDRQSAASTPTYSLACVPKTSSRTLSGSTFLNAIPRTATTKAPSQFNPTTTSTPQSSQTRGQPWQTSKLSNGCGQRRAPTSPGAAPREGICHPCHPCAGPQNARPVSTPVESKGCPLPMCKCVPRTDVSVQGTSSKCPDGGRRDRILKLEILSVKGGTLYDVDKPSEYDPCYDVDPMIGIRPENSATRTPKTTSGLGNVAGGRPPLLVDTADGGSTLRRDESTDSRAVEPSAAQQELGDDDVLRSAPMAPQPFHLSEVSLADMPPVKEEKENETVDALHIGEPPSVDLGDAPFGDVSLPSRTSDLTGLSEQSETQQGSDSDAQLPVAQGSVRVKEEEEGARVKQQDGGARIRDEDGGSRIKEQGGGAPTKAEKNSVSEGRDEKGQTSAGQRTASERAMEDVMTGGCRGSFSLMLGPSVRNFARLAFSPLVALRSLLGPASNGRPVRPARSKMLGRYSDESNPSGHARIRSGRSALVVTPYGASASTFAFLLRRQTNRRSTTLNVRPKDSPQSKSSSEESE